MHETDGTETEKRSRTAAEIYIQIFAQSRLRLWYNVGGGNMKKLREYIIKWTDGQKVRGINVSVYDIEECIRVYNAIIRKEKPEFINGKVKEILDK